MSRPCLLLCSLALLVLPTVGRAGDKDKDTLEGTWVPIRVELNGAPFPPEEIRDVRLVFTKDRVTFKWPREVKLSYKLDTTASPKQIDMAGLDDGPLKGKVAPGIYTLDDGILTICNNSRATKERPTAFSTKLDSGFTLYKLKREKK